MYVHCKTTLLIWLLHSFVLMQQAWRKLRATIHQMYQQSLDDAIVEIKQHRIFDTVTETLYKLTWIEYFSVMFMRVLLGSTHWPSHKAIYLRYDFHAVEVPGIVYQITCASGQSYLTQKDFCTCMQQWVHVKKFPYLCVTANNSIDLTEFTKEFMSSLDRVRLSCYEFCLLAGLSGLANKLATETIEIVGIKSEDLSEVVFRDNENVEL